MKCLIFILTIIIKDLYSLSVLKLEVLEAVNLHCIDNNELYCHPYAVIEFKYSEETKTTDIVQCSKSPQFNSNFKFNPYFCDDVVTISVFQYITTRDYNQFDIKKNNINFLGKIVLNLANLPKGTVEDWFMLNDDDLSNFNTRLTFPSCVKIRISYTSTVCKDSESVYQVNILSENRKIPEIKKYRAELIPPLCKASFTNIYKNLFSQLNKYNPILVGKTEQGIQTREDLFFSYNKNDYKDDIKNCQLIPNQDYAFQHKSNLTFIEENLMQKIVLRQTGELINYNQLETTNEQHQMFNWNEFYKTHCYDNKLTIERINQILKNEVINLPQNTDNPYILNTMSKFMAINQVKLKKERLENVYNNTLNTFIQAESVKKLDLFDDDSYSKVIENVSEVLSNINKEKKEDITMFNYNNQFLLSPIDNRIDIRDHLIFRIYSLYKWNGGHLELDVIRKEFALRRNHFSCYEALRLIPTNIIIHFEEDHCPDNYLCIDPNGIVIPSIGRDPRIVFKKDLEQTSKIHIGNKKEGLMSSFLEVESAEDFMNELKSTPESKLEYDFCFKSKEIVTKIENNIKNNTVSLPDQSSLIDKYKNKPRETHSIYEQQLFSLNPIDFYSQRIEIERLLREEIEDVKVPETLLITDSEPAFLNKFDRFYFTRKKRLDNKKLIIINKVFICNPLIAEILQLSLKFNSQIKPVLTMDYIVLEKNMLKKYFVLEINKTKLNDIVILQLAIDMLFEILVCDLDKHNIRHILDDLMEGLCLGDSISIEKFVEIVKITIIEILFQIQVISLREKQSRLLLIEGFNSKRFIFTLYDRIVFIEHMLIYQLLKQKVIYFIRTWESNVVINQRVELIKREFSSYVSSSTINQSFLKTIKAKEVCEKCEDSKLDIDSFITDIQQIQVNNINGFGFNNINYNKEDAEFREFESFQISSQNIPTNPTVPITNRINDPVVCLLQKNETNTSLLNNTIINDEKIEISKMINKYNNMEKDTEKDIKLSLDLSLINKVNSTNITVNNNLVDIITQIHEEPCEYESLCMTIGYINGPFNIIEKRNKEKSASSIRQFRKVTYGSNILTKNIFNEGINALILNRDVNYDVYKEINFRTHLSLAESDNLAELIKTLQYDKLIILTAIGNWFLKLTDNLIKQVKQIGGLDISNHNRPFFVLGRKGLCKSNGDYLVALNSNDDDYYNNSEFKYKNIISESINIYSNNKYNYLTPTVISANIKDRSKDILPITINALNINTNSRIKANNIECTNMRIISKSQLECSLNKNDLNLTNETHIYIKLQIESNNLTSPLQTCYHLTIEPNNINRSQDSIKEEEEPNFIERNSNSKGISLERKGRFSNIISKIIKN